MRKKLVFLRGAKRLNRWSNDNFDSEAYRRQEKPTAIAFLGGSFASQITLILLVASTLPMPFYVAVCVCFLGESLMRYTVASGCRIILALKDKGKKKIQGKELLLTQSPYLVLSMSVIWIVIWGGFGFISQYSFFEKELEKVEYTDSQKREIELAKNQFKIDSSNAANLLSQAKSEIEKEAKERNTEGVNRKKRAIESANAAIVVAIRSNDVQAEVTARRSLEIAKRMSVTYTDINYTDVENDFKQRLNKARQRLTDIELKILGEAKSKNAFKTFSYISETVIFFLLVGFLIVCLYWVEEYKKLSNIDSFGFKEIFETKEPPQEYVQYEDINRTNRLEIFLECGYTEGQIKSFKRHESEKLSQVKNAFLTKGYELYFEHGSIYPKLRRVIIKKVA